MIVGACAGGHASSSANPSAPQTGMANGASGTFNAGAGGSAQVLGAMGLGGNSGSAGMVVVAGTQGGPGSSSGGVGASGQGGQRATSGAGGNFMGAAAMSAGAGTPGNGGAGAYPPAPTTFDNPIIKYDAPDPTNGPGPNIFTADGAALVWNDKVYLYTDHDEQAVGGNSYLMKDWLLYESVDAVHWQSMGVIMRYSDFSWAHADAMALQVIERDDKNGNPKFYLYAPVNSGQQIGVAVADKPEGPFKDARGIPLIYLEDTANTPATHGWRNLDPTVFIDDGGQAYLGWGNGIFYWVKLEDDMIHLKGETYTLDGNKKMQNRSFSGVQLHYVTDMTGYVEAPYLSKHGSSYYLSFAANGSSGEAIAYATGASPEGPWQYRGFVLDSVSNSFTVHQSIFDYHGASFITYHNGVLPTGGSYRRSDCIDRLYYNPDGTIKKVVQTHK